MAGRVRSSARTFEHVDRGRDRGQRRAQFVGDVGREPDFLLDAALQGFGHSVERRRERSEVGVAVGVEPGAETPTRDLGGRDREEPHRSEDPAARVTTDGGPEHGRGTCRREQRPSECRERAFELGEREHLEVRAIGRPERNADDLHRLSVDVRTLAGRVPVRGHAQERAGQVLVPDRDRRCVPLTPDPHDRLIAAARRQ